MWTLHRPALRLDLYQAHKEVLPDICTSEGDGYFYPPDFTVNPQSASPQQKKATQQSASSAEQVTHAKLQVQAEMDLLRQQAHGGSQGLYNRGRWRPWILAPTM